jgi:predicted N-acetyltransferase YhbS
MTDIMIRAETAADLPAIRGVNAAAFGQPHWANILRRK